MEQFNLIDSKSLDELKFTGFRAKQVDLQDMQDRSLKKIILIGDGMSGKTQIILTFGQLIINYLERIFQNQSDSQRDRSFLGKAEAVLGSFEEDLSPEFFPWAEKFGFIVQYGRVSWDLAKNISLDTETIGFEDFKMIFPYIWKGQTFRVSIEGVDVGGQNIYDHFRGVMGKLAGKNDLVLVIFDKSRAFSCWNSIEQIKKLLDEKSGTTEHVPTIVYVANKVDLEEHIRSQKWRSETQRALIAMIKLTIDYGKGSYSLPSLVSKSGQEIEFTFRMMNGSLSFPDFEAFIYNVIRKNDSSYPNMMTDVNTRAIAREIAAQIVFDQKVVDNQSDNFMVSLMEDFGSLLFQRRPLALQYGGAIEYTSEKSEGDPFLRVRKKWNNYTCTLSSLNSERIESAIMAAGNARGFLEQMGTFYSTNALNGLGIIELFETIIKKKLEENVEISTDKSEGVIRRKIKRF